MKRILIEIDERFVTKWGFIYFGVHPGEDGLHITMPPEPFCLPGFEYVNHPDPKGATFSIVDVDVIEKRMAALAEQKKDPVVDSQE